jgi:hypothetical protein
MRLHYNHYELAFENFPIPKGKIPLSLLTRLERGLTGLAGGVVRLLLEGRSDRPGSNPMWLQQATELQLTDMVQGTTRLKLDAPRLADSLVGRQLDLFGQAVPQEESAYGLVITALREATKQGHVTGNAAGRLLDRGVLHRMEALGKLFPSNEARIVFHNQRPESTVLLNRETLGVLKATEEDIPEPQLVSFIGKLDSLSDSSKLVKVRVEGRTVRVSVKKRAFDPDMLGALYTKEVTVQGLGNYNALRQLVGVEATYIGPVEEQAPALLRHIPLSTTGRLDVQSLRERQSFQGSDLTEMLRLASQMEVPQSYEELRHQLTDLKAG